MNLLAPLAVRLLLTIPAFSHRNNVLLDMPAALAASAGERSASFFVVGADRNVWSGANFLSADFANKCVPFASIVENIFPFFTQRRNVLLDTPHMREAWLIVNFMLRDIEQIIAIIYLRVL